MSTLDTLKERISSGSAVVGVYGLGYVGLPLALRFSEVGIKVIGFDIDVSKVDSLKKKALISPTQIHMYLFFQGKEITFLSLNQLS